MKPYVDHLIVDAAGFLHLTRLETIGSAIYTIQDVVAEIKDKKTLERLQVLSYELNFLSPNSDDIKFATNLAKSTGDYAALSVTDLKLIAAVIQLVKLHVGLDNIKSDSLLRKEDQTTTDRTGGNSNNLPLGFYNPKITAKSSRIASHLEGAQILTDQQSDSCVSPPDAQLKCLSLKDEDLHPDDTDSAQNSDASSDAEDAWITPENLAQCQQRDRPAQRITVACVTNDFAVQNVLMHAGVRVISTNGSMIRRLNTYVLRCFACLKITSVMTSKFCPECGNKTLKRVAITVKEDGTKQIHLSKRRTINTKGFNKPIPLFHGGKHPDNPILCADQPIAHNRLSRKALQKLNVLDADYVARESPFLEKDIYSRSALLGVRKLTSSKTKRKR